jgi:hypothetical protein
MCLAIKRLKACLKKRNQNPELKLGSISPTGAAAFLLYLLNFFRIPAN